MKKVEAVGICVARVVAADPGLSVNCWTALINPEARVTMKKVCCVQLSEIQSSGVQQTYNNKKQEVSSHKVYLDFRPAWNTFKCCEFYGRKRVICQRNVRWHQHIQAYDVE